MTWGVVGESTPRDAPGPLLGRTGVVLAGLSGLSASAWRDVRRANLFDRPQDGWPRAQARVRAAALRVTCPTVLLGRRVAEAFGVPDLPLGAWRGNVTVIPHPSGRNRWYNNPLHRDAVRRVLAPLAAGSPVCVGCGAPTMQPPGAKMEGRRCGDAWRGYPAPGLVRLLQLDHAERRGLHPCPACGTAYPSASLLNAHVVEAVVLGREA